MKVYLLALVAIAQGTLIQKDVERIPDTPEPHLIPAVMKVDQDTTHNICDGTNRYNCREAEPYLRKSTEVEEKPKVPDPHIHPDVLSGKIPWAV